MARRADPVVVLGLGRFGTALALELHRGGTEVLGIDARADVVQSLSGVLPQVVTADTTVVEALREIGVQDFPRAVVGIGTHLEASILTTAGLVDLEIPTIWAKALSDQHATILRRVGAHHVVLPEQQMGERVAHLVSGRMEDWVELGPQWVLAKTKPPRDLVGVPLGDSKLRSRHHVTVVSVKPEGSNQYTHAGYDTVLSYGSVIVIAGKPSDVEKFVELD
ncbi:trk system potassium uptake protein TrkA [Quadrisphaera granulorum]|uniref:Trk system potassium uptake protein TrkA n=1 Tax=Quadrisphaera granulorum TaxID=317664 RepID=A0A315ZNA4_9ACTN|nr:TrkA family potassium uptake protein [Quadrisphaera granulorum]PWJ47051.1 trk system potassium uptake protein TrkA [Quadrisphaera granulorum]SZE98952.1 trk system potassium uptake protein TrkA [Quadrisphaera granulorum]